MSRTVSRDLVPLTEAVMELANDEVDWSLMESVFPREIRE